MLSTLVWTPVIGALLLVLLGARLDSQKLRQISLGIAIATFGWSIYLLTKFDISLATIQLSESLA